MTSVLRLRQRLPTAAIDQVMRATRAFTSPAMYFVRQALAESEGTAIVSIGTTYDVAFHQHRRFPANADAAS